MLTSLTYQRRSGETYQIPIAPVSAGSALDGIRGPTPAPIEYTGLGIDLVASLAEMIETSLDLLSLYRIPIPFLMPGPSDAPAGAEAGPSAPPSLAERSGRQAQTDSRGRGRGTHSESGPSEPVLSDDDDEMSEEAVSPQSESSQDGDETGDGSGSDSGSGADGSSSGPSSRKRTRRASRS
ncbi:uncharacterized protein LOC114273628 [Camellia sinensis]|uniref:uncharacterized protein LOC114273628 n=1 Tax=Camellia sinensis TaxID=4442 RepID=UPI0010369C28|nr:uncharacterized protein LOC114273628 [Camellia sinensis]XP_028071229.1 uncharacterized protein LOC114273628 [Camellia sinensis]